jgi:hypothetical protein
MSDRRRLRSSVDSSENGIAKRQKTEDTPITLVELPFALFAIIAQYWNGGSAARAFRSICRRTKEFFDKLPVPSPLFVNELRCHFIAEIMHATKGPRNMVERIRELHLTNFAPIMQQRDRDEYLSTFSGVTDLFLSEMARMQETVNCFPRLAHLTIERAAIGNTLIPSSPTVTHLELIYPLHSRDTVYMHDLADKFPKLQKLCLSDNFVGLIETTLQLPLCLRQLWCSPHFLFKTTPGREITIDVYKPTFCRSIAYYGGVIAPHVLDHITISVLYLRKMQNEAVTALVGTDIKLDTLVLDTCNVSDTSITAARFCSTLTAAEARLSKALVATIFNETIGHSYWLPHGCCKRFNSVEVITDLEPNDVINEIKILAYRGPASSIPISIHGRKLPYPIRLSTTGPLTAILSPQIPCTSKHCKVCRR